MHLLRAQDLQRMPWKNGGGETMELAVFPHGAGLDTFLWRISMAIVASDGPFSLFPGIDRTLTILAGGGMTLTMADQSSVLMTRSSPPLSFPADSPVMARGVFEAVTDLNVMTRRGPFSHTVTEITLRDAMDIPVHGEAMLLLCREGAADIRIKGENHTLGPCDSVLAIPGTAAALHVSTQTGARLLLVAIKSCPDETHV